jgi:putative iron-regulated protein
MTRALALAALAAAAGCGPPDATSVFVANYAAMMHAAAADSTAKLSALSDAVDAFVAAPSADGLAATQAAWLDTRFVYGEFEVSRFYGGPIDEVQGRVNEWPVDEGFIDYVAGNPTGGIINDPAHYPQLTPAVLASSDERGGIENLSTGYHALEFLLWGQRPDLTAGPGLRPYTDYVDGGTADNQSRRRTYLVSATSLLLSDLTGVTAAWDTSDPTSYGAMMVHGKPHDQLQLIVRTQNRKDEESCFSESTSTDITANMQGLVDVWNGRYGAVSGTGLAALVRAKSASLADMMTAQLQAAQAAIAAIPPPFDHAVIAPPDSDANMKVKAALDALSPLAATIRQIATALGVTVNI